MIRFLVGCLVGICSLVVVDSSNVRTEEMQYPLAVVKGAKGELYIGDRNLPGIWKVENGQASIYFQASKKFRTPLNAVRCLAIGTDGTLYAGDSSTREIYRFDAKGAPQPLTKGYIGIPMGIVIDSKGVLYVADLERHTIFQVPVEGGGATEFVKCSPPRGIAIDKQDRIWVLANVNDSIVRYSQDKKPEVIVKGTPFEFPNQMVVDEGETVYLCDGYAKAIWKVAPGGMPEKFVSGEPLKNPVGISINGSSLMVADPHLKAIFEISTADKSLKRYFPQ